jgi:hypothetical protein
MKQLYPWKPLAVKKGRDNFKTLARGCTDPTPEINKVRVGNIVGRA